jgi:hypothetical protein
MKSTLALRRNVPPLSNRRATWNSKRRSKVSDIFVVYSF